MLATRMKSSALWFLVAIGLFGVLRISYLEMTGAESCPHIEGVPICYLVSIGYGLMFLALLISKINDWKALFLGGWNITFVIALLGTSIEIINGHTCPRGFGEIPLCYLSLAFCLLIFGLFKWIQKPT